MAEAKAKMQGKGACEGDDQEEKKACPLLHYQKDIIRTGVTQSNIQVRRSSQFSSTSPMTARSCLTQNTHLPLETQRLQKAPDTQAPGPKVTEGMGSI